MRIKAYILIILALALFAAPISAGPQTKSAMYDEYQVKTAFLYNFAKLTDWPKEKFVGNNGTITIGIIGKSPFGNNLELIEGERARGRRIVIKLFESFDELKKSKNKDKLKALKKCHILFICSSEKNNLKKILSSIKNHSVLTVGSMNGFLEAGGNINFLTGDEKIHFEINIDAANRTRLKLSSKLIRLAKRVIKEKSSGKTKS